MPKKNLCSCESNSLRALLSFSWPKLHQGKVWYVDFVAFDPATEQMRRKKYHIAPRLKVAEKRRRGAEMVRVLTGKLQEGWNPWVESGNSRSFIALDVALDRYLEFILKSDRAKTRHSYASRVNVLREYIRTMAVPVKYVYQYTAQFVTDFLDYIYLDRDCGARTRNNYRGWCSAFAEWLIERRYIDENPCAGIPKVREEVKRRRPLSAGMLASMRRHLELKDKHFLLACMMEYYAFIRPTELSFVRIRDISVKRQSIYVPAEVSKNKRDGNVGLNESIIRLMIELRVFDYPGDYFLFGKNFRPAEKRLGPDRFNKRWVKMRHALGWGDEFQFYSLKDSGIRDLANEAGIVVARDQARHTDISTTNKYLCGRDMRVPEETKTFKGAL